MIVLNKIPNINNENKSQKMKFTQVELYTILSNARNEKNAK